MMTAGLQAAAAVQPVISAAAAAAVAVDLLFAPSLYSPAIESLARSLAGEIT